MQIDARAASSCAVGHQVQLAAVGIDGYIKLKNKLSGG